MQNRDVLFDVIDTSQDYEENIETVERLHLRKNSLELIAAHIKENNLSKEEKEKIFDYILSLSNVYHKEKSNACVYVDDLYQYIRLIFTIDYVEREMERAIRVSKACMNMQTRVKISIYWRDALEMVEDYNYKLKLFVYLEKELELDEETMCELFVSYHYCTDEAQMKELLQTEVELGHIFVLQRLAECMGGYETILSYLNVTKAEFVALLKETEYTSSKAELTANIIAYELQDCKEYDVLTKQYFEHKSIAVSLNLVSLSAYRYFLEYGEFTPEIKQILQQFDYNLRIKLDIRVVRAYIQCVNKCLKEDLDIEAFIEDTAKISVFKAESNLLSLEWDERQLLAEEEHAEQKLRDLYECYSDKKFLCYLFMNTHFGVLCDFKILGELLYRDHENIKSLLGSYVIRGFVRYVNSAHGNITVKSTRYNMDNANHHVNFYRGVLYRGCPVEYRIVGIERNKMQKGSPIAFKIQLVTLDSYESEAIIQYIRNASNAIPMGTKVVLEALQQFPNGDKYQYRYANECIYRYERDDKVLEAIEVFFKKASERFTVEEILYLYMNSFIRIWYSIVNICHTLRNMRVCTMDEINDLLQKYRVWGRKKIMPNGQVIFRTSNVCSPNVYLENESECEEETFWCHFAIRIANGKVKIMATPVVEKEFYSKKQVYEFVKTKLAGAHQKKKLITNNKKVIHQAKTFMFTKLDYMNLVKGFFNACFSERTDLQEILEYLHYFAPINIFSYQNGVNDSWARGYAKTIWNTAKKEANYAEWALHAKNRILKSGESFGKICYIYMNSPLRYEFSLKQFLMECLENFLIESTVQPCLRLVGCSRNPVTLYGISGFGEHNKRINIPIAAHKYEYFSFELDMDWDGTATAVSVEPYDMKPIERTPLSRNALVPLEEKKLKIQEFFEDSSVRLNRFIDHVLDEILQTDNASFLEDICKEYRIYGTFSRMDSDYFTPLNVQSSRITALKILRAGMEVQEGYVYEMVLFEFRESKKVHLLPVAKYENVPGLDWKNYIRESDVPIEPIEKDFREIIRYQSILADCHAHLLREEPEATLAQHMKRIMDCKHSFLISISNLVRDYYEEREVDETEINEALKNLVIFVKKQRTLHTFNYGLSGKYMTYFKKEKEEVVQVQFSKTYDAVFAMRFMGYDKNEEKKRFHFMIEECYEDDETIPWALYKDISDVPKEIRRIDIDSLQFN